MEANEMIAFGQLLRLKLEAGKLCLDYANTAEWHASDSPVEQLHDYDDLVTWAEQVGLLNGQRAPRLRKEAANQPELSTTVFQRAIALREALYRIFAATASAHPVAPSDIAILNAEVAQALPHLRLITAGRAFGWEWTGADEALDWVLWPVAQSAGDLLTSDELKRVGQCADEHGCGWLFFDTSRNRSRRWCDMNGCGNRAKARRHYRRTRGGRVG